MATRGKRLKQLALGLGVLVGGLLIFGYFTTERLTALGTAPSGERLLRIQRSPNYRDGKFRNTRSFEMMSGGQQWEAMKEMIRGRQQRVPPVPLPIYDGARELAVPPAGGVRVTWLGHSTSLIELDGARILTDPHWSLRASPTMRIGPKRFHPPPLSLDAVFPLDAVVISHEHYDHLDMATVKQLGARGVRFFVPLGIGAHLEGWGIPPAQVTELEWWQEATLPGGVRLASTPAQHFSGRTWPDARPVLWTSWSLIGPVHRVFFSGDTGLAPELPAIGEKYGPFDVTLIEIGQNHPSWGNIHLGPENAMLAHEQLRGRFLLPIHWSTFELAIHAWDEPPEQLFIEAPRRNIRILTPRLGQPVEPGQTQGIGPWWREVKAK